MVYNDAIIKWCPQCQQYLPCDEFYRNAAQSDGLAPYCKPCWREFCRVRHARLREGMQDKRRRQPKEDAKQCSRCQEVKPVSDFYKSDQWIDGLHVYCKKCVLAYQKATRSSFLATLMEMVLLHTTSDLTDDIRISASHLDHLTFLLVLLKLSSNTQVLGLAVPGAKLAQVHITYAPLGRRSSSLMSGCMQVS